MKLLTLFTSNFLHKQLFTCSCHLLLSLNSHQRQLSLHQRQPFPRIIFIESFSLQFHKSLEPRTANSKPKPPRIFFMSLERQLPGHIIYAFYSSNCVHKDLFFSFLAIKSIQKSLPDQGEPLWAEDSRKISHSYHSSSLR